MANVPDSIEALEIALRRARDYTHALYRDLPPALWQASEVPTSSVINPPIWEFGHVAWFAEYFAVRVWQTPLGSSFLASADALYDSRHVPHASRWQLAYPSLSETHAYMEASLAAVLAALHRSEPTDRYRFQLVLVHEYMHAEALLMTQRSLGLPLARELVNSAPQDMGQVGDLSFAGGEILLGDARGRCFQFDNEKPARQTTVAPFAIAASPVSALDWQRFRDGDEYDNPHHWCEAGWVWHETRTPALPHDSSIAMHVNLYEAEAFCRANARRLPTEAEWEFAAVNSPAFAASTGHVWEWTATPFAPFPGFVADIYDEYSVPWFHTHQVLKGGAFATLPTLKYPQYRNFFTPARNDMFAGFRTCPLR